MSESLSTLVHQAYMEHFGSVAAAIQVLDGVIQDQYPKVEAAHPTPTIDSGVFQFYYTGDSYIDPQTLSPTSVHSARKDRTGLIDGFGRPSTDVDPPTETITKAYEKLTGAATSDSDGAARLKTILDRSCPGAQTATCVPASTKRR